MLALPGSLLWLFLSVYFASGQILDTSHADSLDTATGGPDKQVESYSRIQRNEEEKENKKETVPEKDIENPVHQGINKSNSPSNKTLRLLDSPQEFNETTLTGKTTRRQPDQTLKAFNMTEIPMMSQERRNSYLSIAERRKYYNRTRVQIKKPQLHEAELENQEMTNKEKASSTETPLVNEIRVVKKPVTKKSSRESVTEQNPTYNQRIFVSSRSNETHGKPQSIRQSVIQSQYQFGQKLNLRKSGTRAEPDERLKKKKERSRVEFIMENSTNKLNKNYPTLSTRLIKVEKSLWATTATPRAGADHENLVLLSTRNGTLLQKLVDYVTTNSTEKYFSNVTSSDLGAENKNQTKVPHPRTTFSILPLSYLNVTEKNVSRKHLTVEENKISGVSQDVYPKEIFKINITGSEGRENGPKEKLFDSEKVENLENVTLLLTTDVAKDPKSSVPFLNNTRKATETSPTFHARNEKPSTYGLTSPPTVKANLQGEGQNQTTKPFVTAISKSRDRTPNSSSMGFVQNETNVLLKEVSQLGTKKIVFPSAPTVKENESKGEVYPLTIELNENNKRVLSEMFQTVTISEPKRTTKEESITSQPKPHAVPKNDSWSIKTNMTTTIYITPPSSTTTSSLSVNTTTISPQVMPPDDFLEDHKAQGTRFNTKFYVAPNLNKSQVIKIVEVDENEDDEETDGRSRPGGAAIYVLAAFGIIPLLLALVFGTKFIMQRNQREYECESDAKSDISANENPTKDGKKKKGSTDLKKSPSNVTTITLVTATRLPRVQHWENSEKQGTRNWEFPRSKLKLKTILGQGNFGQVSADKVRKRAENNPTNIKRNDIMAEGKKLSCETFDPIRETISETQRAPIKCLFVLEKVWKAEAEDMGGHEGVTRLVAVKTVKEGATEKEHTEFIKELEIMQQIGSHPNIVTLLGCCTDQEPYYLIMEYVKCGKLLTYLREKRINENYYNFSNDSDALTSRDLTVFAYCVARGMEYLASRGIIHRDLAARNVLVDHNKLCKIADFGMSRSVRDFENGQVYEERQQKGALPIRWMAPESLVYSVFTYKSDVWSFGIVMWEIVTLGSTPYPNMGAREVMRKVRDGYRLERPNHCNPEFYRLISHCWAHDPNKRPDFSELRQELSCLLDNPAKDGSYVDLDRFAIDNSFHVSSKTNDFRLLERNDFKTLQKLGDWENKDWSEDIKKIKTKRGRNNGKGTVMLTGQGSFTVNSRILEKEFKII